MSVMKRLWAKGRRAVLWPKLHQQNNKRGIFCDMRGESRKTSMAAGIPVSLQTEQFVRTSTGAFRDHAHHDTTIDGDHRTSTADSLVGESPPANVVVLKRGSSKGSQPELLGEIRGLLRHRLLTSCVLATGAWILLVAFCYSRDDTLINADVLGPMCMNALTIATLLTPAGGLFILCWRSIPLMWMRVVEVSLFGVAAVALAWLRFAIYDHVLDDDFSDIAAGYAVGYAAAFCGFTLYSLIVVHGVFIPNTWCQTLRMALTMAMIVCGAEVLAWRAHPAALLEHFVGPLIQNGLTLMLAIGTAVFGSYKIAQLRTEALDANRRLRELGQYQLKEVIGAGGMGEVYLAEHRLLKRPCAIKLIRPEQAGNAQTLARFEREVQATAQLTHPNTIEIFDYGRTEDGTLYYVMEYLNGCSLDELVRREGPLPPERAVHLVRQVCGALGEAHSQGLVHRDIKPGNVMVCQRGGIADIAKLLDFGLVRAAATTAGGRLTLDGNILGTPEYMPPEQAADTAIVDPRSDIYSVGCLLYFMLTGQPPFVRKTVIETLIAHRQEPPEPLHGPHLHVPSDLVRAIERSLQKNPQDRFANIGKLQASLEAIRFVDREKCLQHGVETIA